jgi:hypothetical protein
LCLAPLVSITIARFWSGNTNSNILEPLKPRFYFFLLLKLTMSWLWAHPLDSPI